jgi:class 3 adenylate cyclase
MASGNTVYVLSKQTPAADPRIIDDPDAVGSAALLPKRRPPLTLSIVIGTLSAFTVVVVAAITFAITYTSSLDSIDNVGRHYCASIVDAGRLQVEDLFTRTVTVGKTVSRIHQQPGFTVPSEDPTRWTVIEKAADITFAARLSNPEITTSSLIYDDGSVLDYLVYFNGALMNILTSNTVTLGTTGASLFRQREVYLTNMSAPRTMFYPTPSMGDARPTAYGTIRGLLAFSTTGLWQSAAFYEDPQKSFFSVPLIYPIRNQSQYIGLFAVATNLDTLTLFLTNLERTPNAHVFVLDSVTAIVASTHPAEYRSFRKTTNAGEKITANCANSAQYARPDVTTYTVACRSFASDFAYDPLRALASSNAAALKPAAGQKQILRFKTGSKSYYAAIVGLRNTERSFQFTLLLTMPDTDILGEIVQARNTVIAIVCVVVVAAAALSAAVIALVLRPLRVVSTRMRRTARLREGEITADGDMSRLAEIYDLQDAYRNMDTAIRSFTRYVPRDVVKDLLSTGDLCRIQMTPKQCTMMFVDIQSFTTMCERVAPDELSELVRSYFESMSSIVMGHEGLIDKFIGDCIMSVWGAPFAVPNAEVKATLCGLRMVRETRVAPLATTFDNAGEQLNVRVGLASGVILAGNMGSTERMNYTVIGDAVNLAARLESLNKQFGTYIMVNESVEEGLHGIFTMRLIMAIKVVGKDTAVKVYEPIGIRPSDGGHRLLDPQTAAYLRAADAPKAHGADTDTASVMSGVSSASGTAAAAKRQREAIHLLEEAARFSDVPLLTTLEDHELASAHTKAVNSFMARDFAGALQQLALIREATPRAACAALTNIVPCQALEDLCDQYIRNPPGSEFDGAWMSHEK